MLKKRNKIFITIISIIFTILMLYNTAMYYIKMDIIDQYGTEILQEDVKEGDNIKVFLYKIFHKTSKSPI